MRHKRMLLTAITLTLCASALRAQTSPYPEYNGRWAPIDSGTTYSLPDFGDRRMYWVRYWNAGGHWAENRILKRYRWIDTVKAGEGDGVAYDGHFLYNPNRDSRKVFFRLGDVDRFFYTDQVVRDPRLTNWWMSFSTDSAPTLRAAVEQSAMTKNFPDVTDVLLEHMIISGVTDSAGLDTLRGAAIINAMSRYTNIALRENLRRTRALVGRPLTEGRFKNLKAGDRLVTYWWDRFGPYPIVSLDTVMITRQVGPGKFAVTHEGNPGTLEYRHLHYTDFWRVIPAPPKRVTSR